MIDNEMRKNFYDWWNSLPESEKPPRFIDIWEAAIEHSKSTPAPVAVEALVAELEDSIASHQAVMVTTILPKEYHAGAIKAIRADIDAIRRYLSPLAQESSDD